MLQKQTDAPTGQPQQFWKNERGDLSIILALSLTVLLILTALVSDFAVAYSKTAQVQTAADAAVLAAGLSLPVETSDMAKQEKMRQTVQEYLAKNGVFSQNAAPFDVTFAEERDGCYFRIGVDVPAASKTFFATVIGMNQLTFTRSAQSRAIACTALGDTVPLSVQEDTLNQLIEAGKTSHVVLKYGKKTGDVVQGAFGALDLDGVQGGGANDYYSWLSNGYQGSLTIGMVLPVESGNMAGPTLSGIRARFLACNHFAADGGCTAAHYEAGCPRVMKVPVVQTVQSGKSVKVVGFAAFVLEDYNTYSSQGYVVGTYVNMVNIGSANGDITGQADQYGVYSLTLSK